MTKLISPSFPIGLPPLRSESQARLGILPKTEYKTEHYKFPREQSRVMKDCEWEGRADALEPSWLGYLNAGCWILFAISMFKLARFVAAVMGAL